MHSGRVISNDKLNSCVFDTKIKKGMCFGSFAFNWFSIFAPRGALAVGKFVMYRIFKLLRVNKL